MSLENKSNSIRSLKPENKVIKSKTFTEDEEDLLCSLVSERKDIVENKKTDSQTNESKSHCWHEIEKAFNASGAKEYRSAKVLKTKYENMKKRCRKSYADRKSKIKATGGGPYKREYLAEKNQIIDEKVQSLIGKTCSFS